MLSNRIAGNDVPAGTPFATRAGRIVAAWLILCGLAFALTGLATIRTLAWPQPTQDQFRLYRIYLEQPFPQNVLQVENQHRPVLPGLLRVAEIHLRDADQSLQIAFGAACAFLTALLLAAIALGAASWPPAARCAGFAAAFIAVFWFGNARMLLHGNELVHAYLLTLSVVAAAYAAWRAGRAAPLRWMAVGSAAAAIATFSFGPGIALFPALVLLAKLQRVAWRAALIPGLACAACLLLYVFVLPGNERVRHVLEFRPWDSIEVATRWIASPWVNAWLGFADPPLNPVHAALVAGGYGGYLVTSANLVQSLSGLTWVVGLPFAFGCAGLSVLAAALWHALRRPPLSLVQACSLTLMLFDAACALIIGVGRLEYLQQRPDQVFADRYLLWPCLFWLGVVLWALASRRGWVRNTAIAFVALLPVVLWRTHELGAGWGATMYRGVQTVAAAVRSDVLDPDVLWVDDPSVLFEDKLRSLQLFRERRLAMFAPPGTDALGTTWTGSLATDAQLAVRMAAPSPARDVRGPLAAVRAWGAVDAGIERIEPHRVLVVLDPRQRIVGYGEFSFDGTDAPRLRWWPRRHQGFDLFIRDYDPVLAYRVAALDFSRRTGLLLGEVPRP